MMFWAHLNGYDYWVSKEKFKQLTERALVNKKKRYCSNPEKYRSLRRHYSRGSKEKQKEYNKKWLAENAEWVKERANIYRKKNAEKIKEQARLSRLRNIESVRLQKKNYAIKYPERVRAQKAFRRVHKRNASVPLTEYEKRVVTGFYADAKRLSDSWGIKWHVDHIMPISRGGKHHPSNLQVIPAIANLRKGNKIAA